MQKTVHHSSLFSLASSSESALTTAAKPCSGQQGGGTNPYSHFDVQIHTFGIRNPAVGAKVGGRRGWSEQWASGHGDGETLPTCFGHPCHLTAASSTGRWWCNTVRYWDNQAGCRGWCSRPKQDSAETRSRPESEARSGSSAAAMESREAGAGAAGNKGQRLGGLRGTERAAERGGKGGSTETAGGIREGLRGEKMLKFALDPSRCVPARPQAPPARPLNTASRHTLQTGGPGGPRCAPSL